MAIMTGKRGQSDTFKLLIAAVVAMAILAIVATILQQVSQVQLNCVSDPLNELTTTLSRAQGGLTATSQNICLKPGESFTSEALRRRVSGVSSITFECLSGASICTGSGAPISVDPSTIRNSGSTKTEQFSAQIECQATGGSGDYTCKLGIKSPSHG